MEQVNRNKGRLCGVVLGILLVVCGLVIGLESTLSSHSFFHAQVSNRGMFAKHEINMDNDNYRRYFYAFSDYLLQGDSQKLEENVYVNGEVQPMFTPAEAKTMQNVRGFVAIMQILRWVAVGGIVALAIYMLARYQRPALKKAGQASLLSFVLSVIFFAILFIWLYVKFLDFYPSLNPLILGQGYTQMAGGFLEKLYPPDFWQAFVGAWMQISGAICIPLLFVTLGLLRIGSPKKNYDEDDHLYQ